MLGDTEVGPRAPIVLAVLAARHHLHVLGATGVGKSTLLTNLVLGDVRAGRGVLVIDPKGDLVSDLLDRLPRRRADGSPVDDVVLLDPEDSADPPTLNLLAPDVRDTDDRRREAAVELAVDQLVGIFRRIFDAYWGPRTDDVLRAACLTLAHQGGASLADVPDLLTNPPQGAALLAGLEDPGVLAGFWSWYGQLSEAERARVVGPVLNKLRAFLTRGFVRRIVGAPTSSLDLGRVLDGGVLLARLPKGVLGGETARLLGSLLVAATWQAATVRARAGAPRRDATLYLDECQNFLTLPVGVEEMLAEARGYHLSLVLAHQHLAQLTAETRAAIGANARNKVFFTLGPEDARLLERHVSPQLSAHDLAHLGAYQAAARLVVGAAEAPAFTLTTRPAAAVIAGRAAEVRAAQQRFVGRDRPEPARKLLAENLPPR